MHYKITKIIKTTWGGVEAKSISLAIMKARKIKPDKQITLESEAHRIDVKEPITN